DLHSFPPRRSSDLYSSIFIAAPLLDWWKEREPEYARRKESVSIDGALSTRVLPEAARRAPAEAPPATGARRGRARGGRGALPRDAARRHRGRGRRRRRLEA